MAGKRLSLARRLVLRDRRVRFGSRKVLRCTVITSGRGAFWVLAILVVSTARMRWRVLLRQRIILARVVWRGAMPFEKAFLTSPFKTLEQSVEPLSISSASSFVVTRPLAKARRIAGCSHIVQRDDVGKFPGARNFKTVIEHRDANVVAPKRVISVRYGINETFKPSELGVFGNCLKCAIGS